MEKAKRIKALLKKYNYNNAESILNEWNYIKGWTNEFVYSLEICIIRVNILHNLLVCKKKEFVI